MLPLLSNCIGGIKFKPGSLVEPLVIRNWDVRAALLWQCSWAGQLRHSKHIATSLTYLILAPKCMRMPLVHSQPTFCCHNRDQIGLCHAQQIELTHVCSGGGMGWGVACIANITSLAAALSLPGGGCRPCTATKSIPQGTSTCFLFREAPILRNWREFNALCVGEQSLVHDSGQCDE